MPEPDDAAIAAADATEAVERIQQIVANARTIWFALLAFLAFIGLTLVSVRDVDFFSLASTTQLPIVNIAIPTTIFFWSAAWLAALMHTYLHLYLLKLWDALADAPAVIGGKPLGDRVFPWLVVDWALRQRSEQATTPRPMDRLADLVSFIVVWTATPAMLTAFWLFSMPAHDVRLTVPIAAALALSVFATANGFRHALARLNKSDLSREEGNRGVPRWPRRWRDAGGAVAAIVLVVSLVRTEFDLVVDAGPLRSSSLAGIDLTNAQIAQRPADWRDRDVAVRHFRIGWCRDQWLTAQACPPLDQPERIAAKTRWCAAGGGGPQRGGAKTGRMGRGHSWSLPGPFGRFYRRSWLDANPARRRHRQRRHDPAPRCRDRRATSCLDVLDRPAAHIGGAASTAGRVHARRIPRRLALQRAPLPPPRGRPAPPHRPPGPGRLTAVHPSTSIAHPHRH